MRRYVLSALVGAACGFSACTVAANLEDWQFYTARRWATGRTAMADIVSHPADRWVTALSVYGSLLSGAASGLAVAGWRRPVRAGGRDSQ